MVDSKILKNMMMTHIKSFIRIFDLMESTVKLLKVDKETREDSMAKIMEMYEEYQEKDLKKIQKFRKRVKRMFNIQRSKSRKRKFSSGSKKETKEESAKTEIEEEESLLNQTFERMISDLEDFLNKSFSDTNFENKSGEEIEYLKSRENALDEDQFNNEESNSPSSQFTPESKKSKDTPTKGEQPPMLKKGKVEITYGQKEELEGGEAIIEKPELEGTLGVKNIHLEEIDTENKLAKVDIEDSMIDDHDVFLDRFGDPQNLMEEYQSRTSVRTNFKWALNKACQTNEVAIFGVEGEKDEEFRVIKRQNNELRKSISQLLRFNFSVDKFKVEPVYDSGFGNLIEVYNKNSFLVQSNKGSCYFLRMNNTDDNVTANELSYNGVPLLVLKTLYLEDLDILFISDKEFLYKLKDGKISIEDELTKTALNILKKSEKGNTIIYLKNHKTLRVLQTDRLLNKNNEDFDINRRNFRITGSLRESAISIIDPIDPLRASDVTGVGIDLEDSSLGKDVFSNKIQVNSNIVEAFIPEENVVCVIDGAYFYKAFRIEKLEEEDDDLESLGNFGSNQDLLQNFNKSKITMIASQRIYTMNLKSSQYKREFHVSKNHLTVVNQLNAIDVFKFSNEYKLEYLASLKHQFSPMSFVKAKIEIFGNPIITVFQKRNDGFYEVFNYLYFDDKFILVENKNRRLLFKDVTKVIGRDERFIVVSKGLDYYHQIRLNF